MDPTLEHDLGSQTKPWVNIILLINCPPIISYLGPSVIRQALSPLISTMPHFSHARLHGSRSSSRSSSRSRHGSPELGYLEEPIHGRHKRHLSVPGTNEHHLPSFPPQKSIEDDLSQMRLTLSRNPYARDSSSDTGSSSSSRSSSSLSLADDVKSVTKVKTLTTKMETYLPTAGPRSLDLHTPQQRQAYFHKGKRRREVTFGPHVCL